jgi:hypothetical protein
MQAASNGFVSVIKEMLLYCTGQALVVAKRFL